jgi:hypothetical protein
VAVAATIVRTRLDAGRLPPARFVAAFADGVGFDTEAKDTLLEATTAEDLKYYLETVAAAIAGAIAP